MMQLPYLAHTLRLVDYERYLLSLFVPPEKRAAVWALCLFSHEISKTRAVVSETTLGLIRLQWWRDGIYALKDGKTSPATPIFEPLAPLLQNGVLQSADFETMLHAREFDLEDVLPETIDGLITYLTAQEAPLLRLIMATLGETEEDGALTKIAINYALIRLIRDVPRHLMERRCYLPSKLLRQYNVSPEKIYDHGYKQGVIQTIENLTSIITPYRKSNVTYLNKMQKLLSISLATLKKNQFDVFCAKAQIPPRFLALRLTLGV